MCQPNGDEVSTLIILNECEILISICECHHLVNLCFVFALPQKLINKRRHESTPTVRDELTLSEKVGHFYSLI